MGKDTLNDFRGAGVRSVDVADYSDGRGCEVTKCEVCGTKLEVDISDIPSDWVAICPECFEGIREELSTQYKELRLVKGVDDE